jgi:hypothetical protein
MQSARTAGLGREGMYYQDNRTPEVCGLEGLSPQPQVCYSGVQNLEEVSSY